MLCSFCSSISLVFCVVVLVMCVLIIVRLVVVLLWLCFWIRVMVRGLCEFMWGVFVGEICMLVWMGGGGVLCVEWV